ncbi:methyl-accepting chemotaxis protein, partial [Viridibacillus sp. YIM B01967]
MKGMSKLSNKVFVFVVIAIVLIIAAFSITLYSNTNKSVEETIGSQTVRIGENVASQLDVEKFKEIVDHPEESELYWKLRDELNDIRVKNGVQYLYTMTKVEKGGKAKSLINGLPRDEEDAPIGSEESTIDDGIMKAVNKDGYYHSGIENFEGYGELLSAIVPMKDADGETIGLIGVDVAAGDVKEVKSEILKSILPIVMGITLVIGVISVFFIRRYTNHTLQPLTVLQEAVVEFSEGNIIGAEKKLESVKFKGNNEITRFEVAFSESLTKLKGTFTEVLHTSEELKSVIDQIGASAQTVHTSNNEIAGSILHIASGSEQQKVNNGEVINAMEEMVIGIQRMADSTSNISGASIDMTALVETGVKESEIVVEQIQNVEQSVLGTAEHVIEMGEKFRSIEEMVEVITS